MQYPLWEAYALAVPLPFKPFRLSFINRDLPVHQHRQQPEPRMAP